eukprot:2674300-Pyramimonas_sp.AAC.2
MIVTGECEVLMRDAAATAGAFEAEEVKVGMRRVGNFVGGLGVKPAAHQQQRPKDCRSQEDSLWKTQAMRRWLVALTVVQAVRQWVGHRRSTSVRALTSVSVVVLDQSDMQWAVEHDYRLSNELQVRRAPPRRARASWHPSTAALCGPVVPAAHRPAACRTCCVGEGQEAQLSQPLIREGPFVNRRLC